MHIQGTIEEIAGAALVLIVLGVWLSPMAVDLIWDRDRRRRELRDEILRIRDREKKIRR